MSETTKPLPGQIDKPNPLELFWEKNKNLVFAAGVAVVVVMVGFYVMRYLRERDTARVWSGFAAATGLDRGYATSRDTAMLQQAQNPQNERFRGFFVQNYYDNARSALLEDLPEDLERVPRAELEERLQAAAGQPTEPLLLWVAAVRAALDEDWAAAAAHLDRLEGGFPRHFLCQESKFPVQWREQLEDDEEEGSATAPPPGKPKRLEYAPPQQGSAVSLLRQRIEAEKRFRAEQARFFEPPAPDSEHTATLTVEHPDRGEQRIVIRFYKSAEKHIEAFRELAQADFWTGFRIHLVRRKPSNPQFGAAPRGEFHFGWRSTKSTDNRAEWVAGEVDPENVVEWEDTGVSHFAGMLAAEPHRDGKSQVERLVITSTDVAQTQDGQRVVFGRVVEGMDVVEAIVGDTQFESQADNDRGEGKPLDYITIKSVAVE